MLAWLRIRDLVLAKDIELEFHPGLNVLSGETGAGKSIVLQAIGLLAGARAAPRVVRTGARVAILEAVHHIDPEGPAAAHLRAEGLESPEPGELVLRREIAAEGRSRAWINGRLAAASQLAEVARLCLEMEGQHGQVALAEARRQADLFDALAGAELAAAEAAEAARRWREAAARRTEIEERAAADADREEFLKFVVGDLEGAALAPDEEASLRAEAHRLANGGRIAERAAEALAWIEEGPDGQASALDLLGRAAAVLDRLAADDPAMGAERDRLAEACALAEEAARGVAAAVEACEPDPERLAEAQERLARFDRALRKHRVATAEELWAVLEAKRRELESIEGRGDELAAASGEVDRRRAAWLEAAEGLVGLRRRAKAGVEKRLRAALKDLDLADARMEVRVDDAGNPESGAPGLRFLFSANRGEAPRPLGEVASGGELSRVLLAVRSALAERGGAATLVFDEIDAGLGGRAARAVGEKLRELGASRQILCVSHQAAIAARAHRHFAIEKGAEGARTTARARLLDGDERRNEVARLLDGAQSGKSRELATELLEKAG